MSPAYVAATIASLGQPRAAPVLPLLGRVDADCAALVQAVHRAGLRPQVCASPWQAATVVQTVRAPLVVVQAAAIDTSPRHLLQALHHLGPVRVALAGLESGHLSHALALDVGFDTVWPAGLRGDLLESALARAWFGAQGHGTVETARAAGPGLGAALPVVSLANASCTLAGQTVTLPLECARALQCLVDAYPSAATRQALAAAAGRQAGEGVALTRRVDMAASRLRQALRSAGLLQLQVRSVRSVGYRLELLETEVHRRGAVHAAN